MPTNHNDIYLCYCKWLTGTNMRESAAASSCQKLQLLICCVSAAASWLFYKPAATKTRTDTSTPDREWAAAVKKHVSWLILVSSEVWLNCKFIVARWPPSILSTELMVVCWGRFKGDLRSFSGSNISFLRPSSRFVLAPASLKPSLLWLVSSQKKQWDPHLRLQSIILSSSWFLFPRPRHQPLSFSSKSPGFIQKMCHFDIIITFDSNRNKIKLNKTILVCGATLVWLK